MRYVLNMDNGVVIEFLRKRQGSRTQKELAEEIGLSPTYLNDVMSGRRDPSDRILEAVGLKWEIVKKK